MRFDWPATNRRHAPDRAFARFVGRNDREPCRKPVMLLHGNIGFPDFGGFPGPIKSALN
jgi:hypothetical protein